jgi:hypothetical protein
LELINENNDNARLNKAYYSLFAFKRPKVLEVLAQVSLWFAILNVFTITLKQAVNWLELVVAILLMIGFGAFVSVYSAPMLSGLLFNGPNINIHFVKEVMKRYPQVDSRLQLREWRAGRPNAEPVLVEDINE